MSSCISELLSLFTTLYHDIVEGGFFLTWNSAAVLFTNLSACSAALTVLIIQKFYQDWGPITALTFRTDGALIMITGSSQGHLAIWDLEQQALVQQHRHAHSGAVTGLKALTTCV